MAKLSVVENKTIEEYWINYKENKRQLRLRELELLHPETETDTNIGGGKSNKISDTTANIATVLADDERYQHLKRITKAVEEVQEDLDDEMKEFMNMRYMSKESNYFDWDDIAYELGVSKAKAFKMRNKLMDLTAEKIGWI